MEPGVDLSERTPGSAGFVHTPEDVARSAGVSTATVSRRLNSPDRVSTHARERVNAAASDLGSPG